MEKLIYFEFAGHDLCRLYRTRLKRLHLGSHQQHLLASPPQADLMRGQAQSVQRTSASGRRWEEVVICAQQLPGLLELVDCIVIALTNPPDICHHTKLRSKNHNQSCFAVQNRKNYCSSEVQLFQKLTCMYFLTVMPKKCISVWHMSMQCVEDRRIH